MNNMNTVNSLKIYTYGDIFELYKDYTWLQSFLNKLVEHKDVVISSQEFESWVKLCNLGIKYTETHKKEDLLKIIKEAKHLSLIHKYEKEYDYVTCSNCKYHYDNGTHFCKMRNKECPDNSEFTCEYAALKEK